MSELAFAIYLQCAFDNHNAMIMTEPGIRRRKPLTRRGWMGCVKPLVRYWFNSYPHCERAR